MTLITQQSRIGQKDSKRGAMGTEEDAAAVTETLSRRQHHHGKAKLRARNGMHNAILVGQSTIVLMIPMFADLPITINQVILELHFGLR